MFDMTYPRDDVRNYVQYLLFPALLLLLLLLTGCGTTVTQAKSSQKPLVQQHTTPSSITLLYYQTADALYGVNARDGKTVWSTSFDPFGTTVTYNQAVVGDGMVYAESTGSDGYYVYAFDAARGTLRWKFRYGGDELRGEEVIAPVNS